MQSSRLVFFSACFGMLLFGVTLITLGSVATGIQSRFNLDAVGAGTLFSILPFGIIAGSLLFGPFADRYGYKIILLVSCVAMFAGFQGIAFATSLNVLKLCVFFFGFGGGAINGATNALVSDISTGNKGANLSLLGVFFAIGALGMPVILGILEKDFAVSEIISTTSYLTLIAAVMFLFTRFPVPKQTGGISGIRLRGLLKDNFLIVAGLFLFCQSGFEGIINNWTTTYLAQDANTAPSAALYALSLYVAGMAVMRLLLGSVFRTTKPATILFGSFALLMAGALILQFSPSYFLSVVGLVSLGAGLAAGFPIILGFVGQRYADVSGTAFSIVISIALAGNVIINFLMGIVAKRYGVDQLITFSIVLTVLMALLATLILKKLNYKH